MKAPNAKYRTDIGEIMKQGDSLMVTFELFREWHVVNL